MSEPAQTDKDQRLQRRWIVAFAAVMGGRMLGAALFPVLLVQAPVVLLLLSPVLAHLVLTGAILPVGVYFAVGIGTSIVQSLIAYWFGLALGQRAQTWLEGQGAATHGATTRVLKWMKISAPIVLIAMAGPPICALAGVARVRTWVFMVAMVIAQITWVGACFWFGVAVTEQVDQVRAFVGRYVIELTVAALVIVGGRWLWRRHRQQQAARL